MNNKDWALMEEGEEGVKIFSLSKIMVNKDRVIKIMESVISESKPYTWLIRKFTKITIYYRDCINYLMLRINTIILTSMFLSVHLYHFFFNLSHINYLKNKIFVTETNTFYIKDTIDVSIKLKDNTERAVCWYS